MKKVMPKGGKKGGTKFPRMNLEKAIGYAKKLVSKTHTGPQTENIILGGVFQVKKGGPANEKFSALKQFNLMTGAKDAFDATELAKNINSAPSEEVNSLLRRACLSPKIFNTLFKTFTDDKVSKAKIRQQALSQGVHPDTVDLCTAIFIESAIFAGLASKAENDSIAFTKQDQASKNTSIENTKTSEEASSNEADSNASEEEPSEIETSPPAPSTTQKKSLSPGIQISITLDSSMDTEKLAKQLNLLKTFGVI